MQQVGIASALGLATIAAPLTGAMAAPPEAAAAPSTSRVARVTEPAPAFPLVKAAPRTAVDVVTLLPQDDSLVAVGVPAPLAAPRDLIVTRVSRGRERAVLPGCSGSTPDTTGFENGKLPATALCTLWDGEHQIRSDAAVAIAKLNVAYTQHFGHPMCIKDAYRTLARQVAVKAQRGSFAATPGTSYHGLGIAADLCDGVASASSPQYAWMRANGPRYGFENPTWALAAGNGPFEPWHWEFQTGDAPSAGD